MSFARDVYTATGGQTDFTISYAYQAQEDVLVYQNAVLLTQTTDYTFFNATTIRLNSGATASDTIILWRSTSQSTRDVDFTAGTLTEADLDNSAIQMFYMAQEAIDIANLKMGLTNDDASWDAENKTIVNLGTPVNATDAATRAYVNSVLSGAAGIAAGTVDNQVLTWDDGAGAWVAEAIGATSGVQAHDADTAKTDVAQVYTAAQRSTVTTLADGATITPDFSASNDFTVTLGGNRTLANPTNQVAGQSGFIEINQDGTGSRTLSFGTDWEFEGGATPTLTTTASATDLLVYWVKADGTIYARVILDLQ